MYSKLLAFAMAALLATSAFAITPIQSNGVPVSGSLDATDNEAVPPGTRYDTPGYYRDVYSFQAQPNETVDITLMGNMNWDCYLSVLDANGNTLQENDDFTGTHMSRVAMSIPSGGTIYVVASSYAPGGTGQYTLTVQSLGVGAPLPADYNASGFPGMPGMPGMPDMNMGMPTAPPIEGTAIPGDLTMTDTAPLNAPGWSRSGPGYYRDIYPGPGNAGEMVSIDLTADFDCYLGLIAQDGTVVAENDDFNSTRQSRIVDAPFPATGTYNVVVTSFSAGETGTYTLTIGNPVPAPLPTADQPISIGQTINGNLAPGANATLMGTDRGSSGYYRDGYTFAGSPNQAVTINLTSSFDGYLFLVGPNGQIVDSNDDYTSTSNSQISTMLTQGGTYRIVVTSYSSGAMGTYTLSLQSGAGVAQPWGAPTPPTPVQPMTPPPSNNGWSMPSPPPVPVTPPPATPGANPWGSNN